MAIAIAMASVPVGLAIVCLAYYLETATPKRRRNRK